MRSAQDGCTRHQHIHEFCFLTAGVRTWRRTPHLVSPRLPVRQRGALEVAHAVGVAHLEFLADLANERL
jgi:hypothetical protein